MSTETPSTPSRRRTSKTEEPPTPPEATAPAEDKSAEPEEEVDPLEILEPKAEPHVWIIGKPPEKGGEPDEWSRYLQRPLGYMARMRFFALVSNTIAGAMREGGGMSLGGADVFTGDAGSLRDRAQALTSSDFEDAGSFMALALTLVGHAPDFLIECYAIWLEVPPQERNWFRRVLNQPYDPDNNRWGITDDQGLEMVEVFIDQNYQTIREFFSGKLPALVRRVQAREQEVAKAKTNGAVDRKSTSVQ